VVFQYTARGFVPAMIPNAVADSVSAIRFLGNEIAATRTEVQEWMPPPSSLINLDSLTTGKGTYRSLGHFKLDNAYPVVEGYRDAAGTYAVAGGVRLNFSDRIGTTGFDLTSSWSPGQDLATDERFHARAVFRHWNWRIAASYNPADFYDLVGPTKTSRKGYSLTLERQGMLLFDEPRRLTYTLQASGYGGLATLPEFQGVLAPFDQLLSFSGDLAYTSLRRSLGAVDDELGTTWGVAMRGNAVSGTVFPRVSLEAAKGFLLPLDHSSLWFRAAAGTALGGYRSNPFANFFFGGFGNNWVDHREEKRYREWYAFPGLDLNEVGGTNFGKSTLEWNLPPIRFRRAGKPGFHLTWARPAVFVSGLVTNMDDSSRRRRLASVGSQLDLRFGVLSRLDMTLSLGYARALEEGRYPRDEYMVSFKVLK
jgi:hypothetical protein